MKRQQKNNQSTKFNLKQPNNEAWMQISLLTEAQPVKIVIRLDIRTEPITDLCMNAYTMNPDEYYVTLYVVCSE